MQEKFDSTQGATIRSAFGHRVREFRATKAITQEELALRCGLDRSYIGQVERGERNISLENIYRIASGLDISPGDLLENVLVFYPSQQREVAK